MIDFEECIEKGLLRKTAPSREQAIMSFGKAKEALLDAQANLRDKRYDATVTLAYIAILNSSRAVLFKDGYRERSHACTVRYLEAKYQDKFGRETINLLDSYRETRHEVQYSAVFRAGAGEAESIVAFAKVFMKTVEKLLK